MSWLIPLFLAGAMLGSAGDVNNLTTVNLNQQTAVVQTRETEHFEQTYPLNATGRVAVSNVNGSITVDVWDNPQVKLEYTKTADTRERLAEVEIKIDARQDSLTVETNFDKWKRNENRAENRNNFFEVQYHLTVPRGAVLDEISTVNGAVNIKDAGSLTKASTVNGEVNATNLRGGTANLSTVNGTVNADFDQLPAGGKIALNVVNGRVNLTIPSDADATLRANSLNGNITNDFGLPVRKGQYVGRDLYGKIGGGAAQIRLNSVNGELSVKRKNDGKNLSPATNLLTNKNDGDDDGDDENSAPRVKPPRPPRPPRAPAPPAAPDGEIYNEDVRRAVEEGLKEAQKEIANLKPELAKIDTEAINEAVAQINAPEMQARLKEAQANVKAILANANWSNAAPRIEEKSESFNVKGTPRVTVEAGSCSVIVRGWDKQEVRYAATRVARTQTPLDLRATQTGDSNVDIKVFDNNKNGGAAYDALFNEASRARIEIFVPKKSDLKITTSGEIRLEGVSGAIDLQGADESINVRDADGRLSVGTRIGAIRVIGFRGAFDGKTADGTMNLEGDFDSFNALASDGTIILTLPENADADLDANTEIESEGVNLIRPNAREKLRRVGRGGAIYRFSVADAGRVLVRGANALKTIY